MDKTKCFDPLQISVHKKMDKKEGVDGWTMMLSFFAFCTCHS